MKKSILLLFFVCYNITFSQVGKIYLKNSKFLIGKENTFVYEPPKGMEIPKEAKVRVIYSDNVTYPVVDVALIKKTKSFEFSVKVPDSINYFIAGIIDGQKVIDNNQNTGYDVFLNSSDPADMGKCFVAKIELIYYANQLLALRLDLKLDSEPKSIFEAYNKLYVNYPMMKEDKSYFDYLHLQNFFDKEQGKVDFLNYAQKCEIKNSEEYWINASSIYERFKMINEKEKIDNKITAKYPKGKFEETKYFQNFIAHPDKTESYILENLATYKTKFNGGSVGYIDTYYYSLLGVYLKNKNLQKIQEYENLLLDKSMVGSIYNNYAWNLSGQDLVTPSKDINYAEKISKRSVDIIVEEQKKSDFPEELQGSYNMYADTYALILYKQNKFEEAFLYQDKINQLGGLDTGGKERYAGMMEKVKGPEITKKYIETELSNGTNSRVLLAQLESIYGKMNLPLDDYNTFKAKSVEIANANAKAEIVKLYGSTEEIDFSLKNLQGKVVNLSNYKGKVVILDFWATWCGPCKASFPAMQELVTKYKDKNVEFLFVNTWERGDEQETTENVNKFINDKKYTFNVVFDFDATITSKYKINGIPTKILIDKTGHIISNSASEQDLIHLIDEQLSL